MNPMWGPGLVRYAAVGAVNTLVGLSTIFAAKSQLALADVPANALGYAAAAGLSFVLHRRWTFGHCGDARLALRRYLWVLLGAYLANLATVLWARDVLRLGSDLAQALGVLPYLLVGYAGSRRFAFASPREPSGKEAPTPGTAINAPLPSSFPFPPAPATAPATARLPP